MAVPPRWANLNIDLVTEIMNRIPCAIDRARMAAVCQAWLAGIARAEDLTFQLPSLFLPPADVTGVYCYLSGCREHSMLPLPGPRYFGSYDGGWFFLAYGQTRGHRLLNIRTGDSHALPDMVLDQAAHETHSMVILAAAISSTPDDLYDAAGIVTYQPDLDAPRRRHFAFWSQGDAVAVCNVLPGAPVAVGAGWEPEDVVYYRRNFLFLTHAGHIVVCTPIYENDDGGNILVVPWKLMPFLERNFRDCVWEWEYPASTVIRACYLVESRGLLHMVVRLAAHHHAPTSWFKVFDMQPFDIIEPDDDNEEADERSWTWYEVEAVLLDRVLFVGRGCSRSYEVSQYPGFKDGIFFLDDRSFYDAEMMFGGVSERQYPCNDIGRWSPPEGLLPSHVEFYFPERVPSHNSPPAWLLP
jgi:hypothetical protein